MSLSTSILKPSSHQILHLCQIFHTELIHQIHLKSITPLIFSEIFGSLHPRPRCFPGGRAQGAGSGTVHRSGTAGGPRAGEAVFAAGVPWWLGGSFIPDNNYSNN